MPFVPEFKGPIEGYVVNFLKKNLWRIANTHTRDEALQEAYVVFLTCASRYSMVETPQHFMALFMTAWGNQFTDLANHATAARAARSFSDYETDDGQDSLNVADMPGELENMGALVTAVRQAPREVAMVLNLFLNAPQELLELATAAWRKQGKYRAEGERWTERMLGLPTGSAPLKQTEEYFTDQK